METYKKLMTGMGLPVVEGLKRSKGSLGLKKTIQIRKPIAI